MITNAEITFPFAAPADGMVVIERPAAHEITHRDCCEGDVFVVSPEGLLHHNHDEVGPYNGRTDMFAFIERKD
jgi:hypothetical protein